MDFVREKGKVLQCHFVPTHPTVHTTQLNIDILEEESVIWLLKCHKTFRYNLLLINKVTGARGKVLKKFMVFLLATTRLDFHVSWSLIVVLRKRSGVCSESDQFTSHSYTPFFKNISQQSPLTYAELSKGMYFFWALENNFYTTFVYIMRATWLTGVESHGLLSTPR